jgi:hypothetical protein
VPLSPALPRPPRELFTREPPFAHLAAADVLSGLMHGSLHLALPPDCEPEWRSAVETCTDPDPRLRPSFQVSPQPPSGRRGCEGR